MPRFNAEGGTRFQDMTMTWMLFLSFILFLLGHVSVRTLSSARPSSIVIASLDLGIVTTSEDMY